MLKHLTLRTVHIASFKDQTILKHTNLSDPSGVVIVGANGFLSSHLQRWCHRNGVPFRAVSRREIELTNHDSSSALAELIHPRDAVVMTSLVPPDQGRDYRTFMANLRMAETVVSAIRKSGCAHFLNLSSDAVYMAKNSPIDESSPCEPVDLYGLAHLAREMVFRAELECMDIPVCTLRLTAVYGPGDTHNAYGPNRFVRDALRRGRILLFGQGEDRRSHIYVDDAVELMGRCLRCCSTGTLNVSVEHSVSFHELADLISGLLEEPPTIAYEARRMPLHHRTYGNGAVTSAFPDFEFTPLKRGLERFIALEKSAVAGSTPTV